MRLPGAEKADGCRSIGEITTRSGRHQTSGEAGRRPRRSATKPQSDGLLVSQIGKKAKKEDRWFAHAPRTLKSDAPRKTDEVYHFLLPDPSMAHYKKAVVKPLAPAQFGILNEWRKAFCAPLDNDEIEQVKRLSIVIDELFLENAKSLAKERTENMDPLTIWGRPSENGEATDFKIKNRRLAGMRGEGARNAVPYQRLKTAMDYWCSLWFWPLEYAAILPSKEEFLFDLTLILEGNILSSGADLFQRDNLLSGADPNKVTLFDHKRTYGQVDIDVLIRKSPRLEVVKEITERARFFHWDLELGDVLIFGDGFDLILGNPPWMRPDWIDQDVLSDGNPYLAIRQFSAAQIDSEKPKILLSDRDRREYLTNYEAIGGSQVYLASMQNYPLIESGRANLYKCFVSRVFCLLEESGYAGLLHPVGHFVDPNAPEFRRAIYQRLSCHFQFVNEMSDRMFADVGHPIKFGINIYRGKSREPNFLNISNLYYPTTIGECFQHDGAGKVTGIKSESGNWELRGHRDRIVTIDRDVLRVFAKVMEGIDHLDQDTTRMPAPHSKQTIAALRTLAEIPRRFSSQVKNYFLSPMWNETTDTKKTKIIRRETNFFQDPSEMVISGPNFYLQNPLAKTPRRNCSSKGDFDVIDLNAWGRPGLEMGADLEVLSSLIQSWRGFHLQTPVGGQSLVEGEG